MIKALQEKINQKKDEVKQWLEEKRGGLQLPIYSSFDLRDAQFKLAIVDSNLFPAGFNNIGHTAGQKAIKAFKTYIQAHYPNTKDILIIPEAHTRNSFYLSNLCSISCILSKAGFNVTIGTLSDEEETLECEDSSGHNIKLQKIQREKDQLITKSFKAGKDGLIILNNDFSIKEPEVLQHLNQKIIPPLELGWTHRTKSNHFTIFNSLITEFAKAFDIDPWQLSALHTQVDNVSFQNEDDRHSIAKEVEDLLSKIKQKYEEYNISQTPYVFVKDNSGTYGMGIITATKGEDIINLNSKSRRKMVSGKGRSPITSVIIQEGVPTTHKVQTHPAEPVIYSAGGEIIGGFMRVHDKKDDKASLNSPGMKFDMLLEDHITKPLIDHITDESDLSIYGIVADIANIAIAREAKNIQRGESQ